MSPNRFLAFTLILTAFSAHEVRAFDYFNGQIDYWKDSKPEPAKPVKPDPPPITMAVVAKPPQPEEQKFDWKKFSDPKNKEFFKEGDYTPPEPFMELARNPTDENIRQWFALVDSKNRIMGDLNKRIGDYVAKNGSTMQPEEREIVLAKQAATAPQIGDFKRFRFRLYFDSTCPHCKDMMGTMKELQDLGYYVEVKQVDNRRSEFPIPFSVVQATPAELQAKNINAWPVTFVADTTKQVVYRLNGYLSKSEFLNALEGK